MSDTLDTLPLALGRMSYPQVEQLLRSDRRKLVLLPTGSTEAHGPHLPLLTDSIIAERMAERACEKLRAAGFAALVAPPLHYAVTDWAADFAGSAGITPATAKALIGELAHRFATLGFDATVLINAHLEPDNIATLRALEREYRGPGKLIFPDKTRRKHAERLGDEFRSGSCHAGSYETSLVLAVAPAQVDVAQAHALPEHHVALHEHIAKGARSFAECGLDRAYCGKPADASAEQGAAHNEVLSDIVVEVVREAFASG
jgi:creatinine amidohydrolase